MTALGLGAILSGGSPTSEFLPSNIDDCKLWFTYEEGLTLDGSLVNCWTSQVGSFYGVPSTVHNDDSPGTDRPTFNTTHVTFDGGDDIDLMAACGYDTDEAPLTLVTINGGWTVLAIYTDGDWDGAHQVIFGKTSDSADFLRHDSGIDRFRFKANSSANKMLTLDSGLTDDQYYCIMVTSAADGTLTLYVDNVAQSATPSIASTDDFVISALGQRGASDRLSGHIKHAVAYDRILTSDERSQIQDWASEYIG